MKKSVKILGVIGLMAASFVAGAIVEGKLREVLDNDDDDWDCLNDDTNDDIDYEIRDEKLEDEYTSLKGAEDTNKKVENTPKKAESDNFFDEEYYEKLIENE